MKEENMSRECPVPSVGISVNEVPLQRFPATVAHKRSENSLEREDSTVTHLFSSPF